MRKPYPDDLTDHEWAVIEPILKQVKKISGRPPIYSRREMLNAMFYLLRTGCSWRHLPHDFPPWKVVYDQFLRWRQRGTLEEIHAVLRRDLRKLMGRKTEPTAGIIDSQSVKTTEKGALKGMTVARKSKGENDICWLILRD